MHAMHVQMTLFCFSECAEDGDFSFIIDSSRNIGLSEFEDVKEFVSAMMYELNIANGDSRVGIMTYGDAEPTIHANLGQYNSVASMAELVRELRYEGGETSTSEALRMAREVLYDNTNGNRPGVNDVIVLFTNGYSSDFDETLREAVLTKLSGMTIIVVAVSTRYNEFELKEIASDPDRFNVFALSSVDDVGQLVNPVRRAICNSKF